MTAGGCQDAIVACTRTATSALAWEVSATSPSIPAVLRPALRCVTCRTLSSVLDQLRSISFCRFLTLGQSPSCAALKIRCRSRRTSPRSRQSTASQSTASQVRLTARASSGPFTTSWCLTCPSVPAVPAASSSKAHLPTSAPFRARAPGPVSGQLSETASGGLIDLISVSCRLSAAGIRFLGILFPPGNSALLTVGLPPPFTAWRTLTGFPCSARMRHGWGWVPPVPRGRRCPHGRDTILGRRPPPSNGRSLSPRPATVPGCAINEASARVHWHSPLPSLPLACGPRTEREPLGFPVSFAPDRLLAAASRTSRWGQVSDTDPDYVFDIG